MREWMRRHAEMSAEADTTSHQGRRHGPVRTDASTASAVQPCLEEKWRVEAET